MTEAEKEIERFFPKYTPCPENSGQRIVPGGDGNASVPNLPYLRAIDPDGNVVPLVVSTNRDPRERDMAYQAKMLASWQRAGGYLYDEPPFGVKPADWPKEREKLIGRLRAESRERALLNKPADTEVKRAAEELGAHLLKVMRPAADGR